MKSKYNLKGKRCICLARVSNDAQGETSTEAQLTLLHACEQENGAIHIDDVVLNGVGGSHPGNRKDLDDLFRRAERKEFDVLLVQRNDRLTRGGADHQAWIKYEFTRNGVTVVALDGVPEELGRFGALIEGLKAAAAQEVAVATAERSTQGYQQGLERGWVTTSSRSPYGTYRHQLGMRHICVWRSLWPSQIVGTSSRGVRACATTASGAPGERRELGRCLDRFPAGGNSRPAGQPRWRAFCQANLF